MQDLKESGISSRLAFAHWMNSRTAIVKQLRFSDKALFIWMLKSTNRSFWGTERPEIYIKKHLHGDNVTAWAALIVHGYIRPFCEDDDGHVTTINKDRYITWL